MGVWSRRGLTPALPKGEGVLSVKMLGLGSSVGGVFI